MSNKVTVKSLLAKKEELKNKKKQTLTLYVESLGGEITVEEPSRALSMEAIGMSQDPVTADKADAHMVYNCVVEPNLRDPELQQEFGCVEPTDIVDMIFRAGDIVSISGYALELSGYSPDATGVRKVDKDLKN